MNNRTEWSKMCKTITGTAEQERKVKENDCPSRSSSSNQTNQSNSTYSENRQIKKNQTYERSIILEHNKI